MAAEVKKRSAAIDMVKGLSIMTLFFLHFENGYFNFDYNYFIVRSPAFYMVVGWLWGMSSNRRTIQQHWAKRKQGLVKPYIWLSILFIIFDAVVVLLQVQEIKVLFRDIYKTLCLRGIGTLWFLPALLGGEMLFLKVRDTKPSVKIGSYFVCMMLIYTFYVWGECQFMDNSTYRDLLKAPVRVVKDVCDAFIYISIAYYSARHFGEKIMSQPKWKLFAEGLILLIVSFVIMNTLPDDNLFYMLGFMGGYICSGFGILFLFTSIESIGVVSKPLEYFGKNSLVVMAFHFCLLYQIALIFDRVVMHHDSYSGGITVIYFAIAVLAQIVLIEIINRKFKFLIGK